MNGVGSYGLKGHKEEKSYPVDTTKFKIADKTIWIFSSDGNKHDSLKKKNKFNIYWAGFNGINGYLNANNGTTVSKGFDLIMLNPLMLHVISWNRRSLYGKGI